MGYQLKNKVDSHQFWIDPLTARTFSLKKNIPPSIRGRCEHWDSELEYRVHQQLLKLTPHQVKRQQDLLILPKSSNFKEWVWCIDFVIAAPTPIYIEAKGKWLLNHLKFESFWKTLRILEVMHPAIYNNLIFVGSNKDEQWSIPQTKLTVYPIRLLPLIIQEKFTCI